MLERQPRFGENVEERPVNGSCVAWDDEDMCIMKSIFNMVEGCCHFEKAVLLDMEMPKMLVIRSDDVEFSYSLANEGLENLTSRKIKEQDPHNSFCSSYDVLCTP